jgi:leucine dehydrogenase
VFGSPDLAGRIGAGAGRRLRRRGPRAELADAGARVLVSDVDEARAAATGCETVAPERVFEAEVDVYSPCAVGGTLNAESIPRLACRAIAGCANNQLAEPRTPSGLQERGILYAPDYIVNAGGIIQLIGLEDEGWDEDSARGAAHGESATRCGRSSPKPTQRESRPSTRPTGSCAGRLTAA